MPRKELYEDMNLCLKMEGLTLSFKEFRAWRKFTLTEEEAYEELNELNRAPRLMNLKSYVRLHSSEPRLF